MARLHNAIIVVPDTAKLDCLVPNLAADALVAIRPDPLRRGDAAVHQLSPHCQLLLHLAHLQNHQLVLDSRLFRRLLVDLEEKVLLLQVVLGPAAPPQDDPPLGRHHLVDCCNLPPPAAAGRCS